MRADYASLGARARGLALHLASRAELERYAALPDPPALARALEAGGRLATPLRAIADSADIEVALRRTVARELATLARWAGPANPVLDAFYAEQDRRSLRSLLRGATEGAPAEDRIAGLLPTPQLPVAALAELAEARTPREIALRLSVLGDAHAAALVALTAGARVDLLEVELMLARVLATRLAAAARRGDAALAERVRARLDLVNAQAALALAGRPFDLAPAAVFVAGGRALDRDTFVAAASAASMDAAAAILARAFAGTALARPFERGGVDAAALDLAALGDALAALRRTMRVDPLGSAPVQHYLLRLDAHSRDVRRLAWGLALGMPAAELRAGLVTP